LKPLDDGNRSVAPVDPAAIDLDKNSSITIDISGLLHSQAVDAVPLGTVGLKSVQELAGKANIAPLIGLLSRSVDFALGFVELPHFRVLIILSERDSISAAEIVQATKATSRKTLALLDSMENAGWIHALVPGRGVTETVAITEKGRALVEEVTTKRQQEIDEILQRLSEADRALIAKAFSSFATAANEPQIRRRKNGIAP
jgi:DNA-binding MarR family transcriptional regulator